MVGKKSSAVRKMIRESIGTGEVIEVVYLGGSQPGSKRRFIPLQIDGDYLRARCLETNRTKVFLIDKIQMPDTISATAEYNIDTEQYDVVEGFAQLTAPLMPLLESYGWTVITLPLSIRLFKRFKNGKPRKSPTVSIERIAEYYNPWTVISPSISRHYSKVPKALNLFKEEALTHAPGRIDG